MADIIKLVTNDGSNKMSSEFSVSNEMHEVLIDLKYLHGFVHFDIDFLSDDSDKRKTEPKEILDWLNTNVFELSNGKITIELFNKLLKA